MPLDLQPQSPLHTPTSSPSAPYPAHHHPQQPFNPFLSSTPVGAAGNDLYGQQQQAGPSSQQQQQPGPPPPQSSTPGGASSSGGGGPSSQQQQQQSAVASPITGVNGPPSASTTPAHTQAVDLLGGLGMPPLMAGASPTSSLAPSRQPSSSGGANTSGPTGGGGTFTPDLSARINAMSLESKIRDIEGCARPRLLPLRPLTPPSGGGNDDHEGSV